MIKTDTLLKSWKVAEYDKEAIENEYRRLYNAIQALYENSLISRETREKDYVKLKKAYQKAIAQIYTEVYHGYDNNSSTAGGCRRYMR